MWVFSFISVEIRLVVNFVLIDFAVAKAVTTVLLRKSQFPDIDRNCPVFQEFLPPFNFA
jgi:hypothetical protein